MAQYSNLREKIKELAQEKALALEFYFGLLDTNKDGKISKAEFDNSTEDKRKLEFLKRMDLNKDGDVTTEEVWECIKKDMRVTCTKEEDQLIDEAAKQVFRVREFFKWASDDKYQVTLEDIQTKQQSTAQAGFKGADKKHKDAYLKQLGTIQNMFSRIDTNKDRRLHLWEVSQYVFDITFPDLETELKMLEFFNEADVNGNGFLDDREVTRGLMGIDMEGNEVALNILESMEPGPDGISYSEFINQWKRTLRNEKFPVKCKRGMQHTETELIKIAEERAKMFDHHKRHLNAGMQKSYPECFTDWIQQLDKDNDGVVDFDEFWDNCKKEKGIELTLEENQLVIAMSKSYDRLRGTFDWIDQGGDYDGKLTITECFAKFPVDNNDSESETVENIVNIFHRIDTDKNDVTFPELWDFFRAVEFPDITKEIQMLQFFHDADQNGDGALSFNEVQSAREKDSEGAKVLFKAMWDGLLADDGFIDIGDFMGTWKRMLRDEKYPKKQGLLPTPVSGN